MLETPAEPGMCFVLQSCLSAVSGYLPSPLNKSQKCHLINYDDKKISINFQNTSGAVIPPVVN